MDSKVWLLLSLALVPAPLAARHADSAAVVAAVAAYDAAWERKDTVAAGRWMAPGYQYFTSVGGVWSRAEMLEFLASPDYRLDRTARSEVAVTVDGSTAVVASRWQGTGQYKGNPVNDDQRCGLVLVRRGQEWQLLAEHCAQIRES